MDLRNDPAVDLTLLWSNVERCNVDPSGHDRNDLGNGSPWDNDRPTHTDGPPGEAYRWLSSVVENSPEIVKIVDPDGTLRYASPAFGRILGYDPEEAVDTMNVFGHVHPEDLQRVVEETEKVLSGEGVSTNNVVEYRFRHKDGSWRWMEGVGTYLPDDPAVRGVVVSSRDVTKRKEAETSLREAEERYRTLVEQIPAVTYIDRADGSDTPLYTSPQIEKMLGYTSEEWRVERLWPKRLHPEDRDRLLAADELFEKDGEERFGEEYRLLAKDGSVVWVREEAVLVKDREGRPLYWQGILYDLTERKEAEGQLRLRDRAISATSDGIIITDPNTVDDPIVYVNAAFERITGYEAGEVLGRNCRFLQGPHRDQSALQGLRKAIREGQEFRGVLRNYRKDGSLFFNELHVTPVRDGAARLVNFIGVLTDVTLRIRAEEALRKSEERYRTVVEEQTELVCRFLPDLTLTFVNDAYCRYFGEDAEELVGSSFLEHIPAGDRAHYEGQSFRLSPENPTRTVEHRVFAASDGEVRWQQWTDRAIFDAEGTPVEYQSVGRDITDRKVLEDRLRYQAFHDPLTNLPNRHLFLDRLGQALRRTRRRRGRRVAILFMDLDNFKSINDSLGHEAGDLLLTVAAERLKGCLRPEDTLARFGGDEFVVLLEDVNGPDEAVRVAERITDQLRYPFLLEDRELYAGASIGIALGEDRTESPDDLLRGADTAMYRAKDEGSGYSVFEPTMHERALRRLEAESDLRRAIEHEEFVVHYQPIVQLDDGRLRGVEALVRWEHPERGLLNPGEFIAVAEESGLVIPMGEQVLREACARAKEWHEKHTGPPPLVVSVNLSGKQLSRPDLAEVVEGILEETGLEGNCLILDVTETVYVKALEGNTQALDRLRAMGVGVSIDDFGTGYSSLSYLKRLPADAIKIDRSFVAGLGESVEDTAIVRMVVELAHTLGMEVVAEGVEDRHQADLLGEIGCDMAQGFHFARPLPHEEFSVLLSPDTHA